MTTAPRSPRAAGWHPRPQASPGPRTQVERRGENAVHSGAAESAARAAGALGIEESLAESAAGRLGGRAIALAGVVVVLGVVLSRVLGFVRTGVLNAEFGGQSPELAAFNYAFRIPDTLFQLVAAGAIGSALVPVASELIARGEDDRARRVVATLANLMVAVLVPLALLVWVIAPWLVSTLLVTGHPELRPLTTDLTRWLLLSPILLAVGAVATAGLQALGIFGAPALAPNVYNVAIIVAALALTPFFGVYALVLGVVVGAAGHVAIQLPPLLRHGLYRPTLDTADPAVREILRLMAPRALGLGATQIVFFLFASLVSLLNSTGAITIWNTAFITLQIPVGLIGVPLGIVLLPPLSRAVASGDTERFRYLVDRSLRLLLYVAIPLTAFMVALAAPGNTVLWRHGEYTASDVSATIGVFLILLFGLVAHILISLLAPIFYAGKDTRTPVIAALVAVAVDAAAALVLFPFFKLEGLAFALGLGAWAEVALLLYLTERRIGFDLHPVGRAALRFVPPSLLAGAAAFGVDRLFATLTHQTASLIPLLIDLGIAGAVGLGAYVAWSVFFGLDEFEATRDLARSVLRRGSSRPA